MPKQKSNASYLEILQKLQDAEEPYSNRWMTYRRAYSSLRDEKRDYVDVGDLKAVKFIGDVIISKIRKALAGDGDGPQPVSPSKRGPSDSSISDARSSKAKKRMRNSMDEEYNHSSLEGHGHTVSHPDMNRTGSIISRPPQGPNISLTAAQFAPLIDVASAKSRPIGASVSFSTSTQLPTPPATQPRTPQSTPVLRDELISRGSAITGKDKKKHPIRGRTSEFVPTFSPVDEFDSELGKQSGLQPVATENHTHTTADLIDDITDLTTSRPSNFAEFEPIVFQPGSFEVTLILDNREIKSREERSYIRDALRKRQISVEQRSLAVGDVLWIAKCRFPSGAAVIYECVLDYVLERKRLDDLCGSIKDGRFLEQKFRLANTGLKVFYLVESHETEKHREIFGVQIDTARSSTQIVDGFILKETSGLQASIDYLETMHKTIYEIYHNKPLYVIPPNLIKRHSYLALQKHLKRTQPYIQYMTSYGCFERLNDKSANLTTRDLFAQMSLCIKGVSAEKAAVIIQNFPTMRSLWEAFKAADTAEAQDRTSKKPLKASEMLCRLDGEGRKHFGPTLSTNIYNLFRK